MAFVAVAGGTGSIGRSIVEAIVAEGKCDIVVLSRKIDKELEKKLGARLVVADYSSVDSLVKLLEENNVSTVVSALGAQTPPQHELNLIQAADKSAITKRYIPSVWGIKYRSEHSGFPIAATKLSFFGALEKTGLEWTAVSNGFFLDYWGLPKIKSYLSPFTIVLDIPNKAAAIPGTGTTPVTFTYSGDVGKFTARLLTLDKWEEESFIVGDKLTWNDFLKLAEEVTGDKFTVVHDSIETLQAGKVTELPSHVYAYDFFPKEALQGLLAQFGIYFHEGVLDFQPKQTLNGLFPDIKPKSAREVLEIGWKN